MNLGHDESLGTLPEEMRRHQFDGLSARGVEHHRPLPVDRDGETRGGTLEPSTILGRRRDVVRAVGKAWQREGPSPRFGIASHPTREHAVEGHIHPLVARRHAADGRLGGGRLAIPLRAGIREAPQPEGRHGRRRGHDRDVQWLGELSSPPRRVERTDSDRVLAGSEGRLGRNRVRPSTIGDRQQSDSLSVDEEPHLTRRSPDAAAQGGRPVGGQVVRV